jgi:GTP-binding protein
LPHRVPTHHARFVAGVADPARLPRMPHPEIAFAGRSNVGKSSLLNRFVGRRGLARVSKTPGRTQQINFFLVDERLTVVDLPGYGFARVPAGIQQRWKDLVEGYLTRRPNLCAVAVIIDVRRGVENDDQQLIAYLHAQRLPVILILTKADKLGYGERHRRARAIETQRLAGVVAVVLCSARTGLGIPELRAAIESLHRRRHPSP